MIIIYFLFKLIPVQFLYIVIYRMNNLNVHRYDGKLSNLYKSLTNWDKKNLKLNINFKETIREMTVCVIKRYNGKFKKMTLKVISIIANDANTMRNHDPSNDIKVEDILPRIWRFYRELSPDDQYIFFEQVCDFMRGLCPQGRAGARLFQLYSILISDSKDIVSGKKLEINDPKSNNDTKTKYLSLVDVIKKLIKK